MLYEFLELEPCHFLYGSMTVLQAIILAKIEMTHHKRRDWRLYDKESLWISPIKKIKNSTITKKLSSTFIKIINKFEFNHKLLSAIPCNDIIACSYQISTCYLL